MYQQDQQYFTDFLYAERYLANLYHEGSLYATTPGINAEMFNLLADSHEICAALYGEIEKRQWIKAPAPASSSEIELNKHAHAKFLKEF